MKREHIAVTIFAALIVIALYLFFRILRPFFVPIIWGAVLAGLFFPLNDWLRRRMKRDNVRAVIMCLVVVALIVAPALFLAMGMVGEATSVYPKLKDGLQAGKYDFLLRPQLHGLNEKIDTLLGGRIDTKALDVESFILGSADRLIKYLLQQASGIAGNLAWAVVNFIFTVISMFYFFRDWCSLGDRVRELLPMSEDLKTKLATRVREVMRATIYGGIMVGAVQGVLEGLIFWMLGVQSPIFWGATTMFLALLPPFGHAFIYVPAGVILIASGSLVKGIVMLALGIGLVSNVDNVLKPVLIGRRTKIHQLIVFFSMLGGLKAFGVLGLVLGPVLASVLLALLEVYKPHTPPAATPGGAAAA
jgi:predicted PurR-regulated permease PerM